MPANQFKKARKNMIEGQLRPNKIIDEHLISAMMAVPRENFVPITLQGVAYVDEDLPVGKGQHLMEPIVFARLLQAAAIKQDDVVLDIACGRGYSTAILSHLAATVIGIEQEADFAKQADTILEEMDICNVATIHGNIRDGYKEQAPFNVILINGAIPHVPGHIIDQLADGGRLITIISENGRIGKAVLMKKEKAVINTTYLFDAMTPLISGFEEHDTFTF